jgi:hypothetical protein
MNKPFIKNEILEFTALPAGWWNYNLDGVEMSPCPGIIKVRTTEINSNGDTHISESYQSAAFSEGWIVPASENQSYEYSDYAPSYDPATDPDYT